MVWYCSLCCKHLCHDWYDTLGLVYNSTLRRWQCWEPWRAMEVLTTQD